MVNEEKKYIEKDITDEELEMAIDDFIMNKLFIEENFDDTYKELENHMVIGEYYEND